MSDSTGAAARRAHLYRGIKETPEEDFPIPKRVLRKHVVYEIDMDS